MAITVISYAPVGHSYFHTPPAFQATPSILEGELASRSTASRSAFDGKETAPPLSRGGVAKRRGRMIQT